MSFYADCGYHCDIRLIQFGLYIFVQVPWVLFAVCRFFKKWSHNYIQKRHPELSLSFIVSLFLNYSVVVFLDSHVHIQALFYDSNNVTYKLYHMILMASVAGICFCLAIRMWYLYYDIRYSQELADQTNVDTIQMWIAKQAQNKINFYENNNHNNNNDNHDNQNHHTNNNSRRNSHSQSFRSDASWNALDNLSPDNWFIKHRATIGM